MQAVALAFRTVAAPASALRQSTATTPSGPWRNGRHSVPSRDLQRRSPRKNEREREWIKSGTHVATAGFVTLFDPLRTSHRALDYHLERHNVLASNVANIDTPNFRPAELVRHVDRPGDTSMKATNAGHIGGARNERGEALVERVVRPGGDGNAVSLEREMAKVAANDLRFETIGRIVRQQLGALRYAASDGNG